MSAEKPQSLQEAAGRMAACLNHACIEFNNFLAMAKQQHGLDLLPTPPAPGPVLDTALLDSQLDTITQDNAGEVINGVSQRLASVAMGQTVVQQPGSIVAAQEVVNDPAEIARQFAADEIDQQTTKAVGEIVPGYIGQISEELAATRVPSDEKSLEELIAATRVRTEAAAKVQLGNMEKTMNNYLRDNMDLPDALQIATEQYKDDKIVGALLSALRFVDDLNAIREFTLAVGEKIYGPREPKITVGQMYDAPAAELKASGRLANVDNSLAEAEATPTYGPRTLAAIKGERNGDVAENTDDDWKVGTKVFNPDMRVSGFSTIPLDKLPSADFRTGGDFMMDMATKINPDGKVEVVHASFTDANGTVDLTPPTPEDGIVTINGSVVFGLGKPEGELSSTIGDTPGYEQEAQVRFKAVPDEVKEVRGFNGQVKFEELLTSYKNTYGASVLDMLLSSEVIETGQGHLGYTEPKDVEINHLFLGRFEEDVLSIHPSESYKFPMGVYSKPSTGTEALYITTSVPYREYGVLAFAVDNFRVKPTFYVCGRQPNAATDWVGMEQVQHMEEVVEFFLAFTNQVKEINDTLVKKAA